MDVNLLPVNTQNGCVEILRIRFYYPKRKHI